MSQYDRLTGVKRLRVRGMKAVRFAAVMKAIAINIVRAVAVNSARARAKSPKVTLCGRSGCVFQVFKERIYRIWRYIIGYSLLRAKLCTYAHNLIF